MLFNISDDGQPADCIFVFGSNKAAKYRVPRSVELYKQKRAEKLLFSGGTIWKDVNVPESVAMQQRAMELGIPEKDIIVETASRSTKENVLSSLTLLDQEFMLHNIKRILLVTSPFHMRRAYLTMRTYMPSWIEFSFGPASSLTHTLDTWYEHEGTKKRALEESKKIIEYVHMGALKDDVV
nr:YdcF family protein [Paenibacillus shirakamiensis]